MQPNINTNPGSLISSVVIVSSFLAFCFCGWRHSGFNLFGGTTTVFRRSSRTDHVSLTTGQKLLTVVSSSPMIVKSDTQSIDIHKNCFHSSPLAQQLNIMASGSKFGVLRLVAALRLIKPFFHLNTSKQIKSFSITRSFLR